MAGGGGMAGAGADGAFEAAVESFNDRYDSNDEGWQDQNTETRTTSEAPEPDGVLS
jgi:hypothetical protein